MNAMFFDGLVQFAGTLGYPAERGRFAIGNMVSLAKQSLPNDPIGTHTLTLTNVVVGSRVFIRDQANTTTHYDQIAGASTVVIPLQVYVGGSPLNNWSIKVRKSSAAPKQLPYETSMTATAGSSSIFVSQVPDTIAS